MSYWILETANYCSDFYDFLIDQTSKGEIINIDETPVQVFNEENKKNTTKSYMWVLCGISYGRLRIFYY